MTEEYEENISEQQTFEEEVEHGSPPTLSTSITSTVSNDSDDDVCSSFKLLN